jgi:hypothetical protein
MQERLPSRQCTPKNQEGSVERWLFAMTTAVTVAISSVIMAGEQSNGGKEKSPKATPETHLNKLDDSDWKTRHTATKDIEDHFAHYNDLPFMRKIHAQASQQHPLEGSRRCEIILRKYGEKIINAHFNPEPYAWVWTIQSKNMKVPPGVDSLMNVPPELINEFRPYYPPFAHDPWTVWVGHNARVLQANPHSRNQWRIREKATMRMIEEMSRALLRQNFLREDFHSRGTMDVAEKIRRFYTAMEEANEQYLLNHHLPSARIKAPLIPSKCGPRSGDIVAIAR